MLKSGLYLGILATSLAVSVSLALAQSACIHCSGPSETYECHAITDDQLPEKSVGLYCASRIAHDYHHEICAAQREAAECPGIKIEYVYETEPPLDDTEKKDLRWSHADPKARKDEPETLGEFASETIDQSAKTIKKAGDNISEAASKAGKATTDTVKNAGQAIGSATKKTLKCLGSALNDC